MSIKRIPVRKVKPWHEGMSQKVLCSNPGADKGFFYDDIFVKMYVYDHLAMEFLYYRSVSSIDCIHSHGAVAQSVECPSKFPESGETPQTWV